MRTVDGQGAAVDVPVRRANLGLMAVALPAGRTILDLTYVPVGLWPVVWLSLLGAVVLVVAGMDRIGPTRAVPIFDGMVQVGDVPNETDSVTFQNLRFGNSTALLFTAHDDYTATGEAIFYSGNTIGGASPPP